MARSIVRFDPFAGLETMRRDLFDDGFFRAVRGAALPTVDVYTEDDKALVVEAHLPRFREEDITVNIDGGQLVIQADRSDREEDKGKRYVVRESSSSFYRTIALPDSAEQDAVSARFEDGVLKIEVPLAQAASPRKIAITS